MLVQNVMTPERGSLRPTPGILDSPTLARVERAMLRHEGEGVNLRHHQTRVSGGYTQALLSSLNSAKDSSTHAIKRGLLWQQRDRLFSRWKERYFILTRDYLHCFRRASGNDRISEMGQFLFKVKLVDVDRVEWENKKTYSTVALVLDRDGKIYLRAADGLEDWFELLEECMLTSKERRRALRHSHDGRPSGNNNITASFDEWLAARQKIPSIAAAITKDRMSTADSLSTTTSSIRQDNSSPSSATNAGVVLRRRREWMPREEDWENPTLDNRLSLLTDIDINSYDDSTLGAPSITSYRMNEDVLCIQPPSLRTQGSFRSTRDAPTSMVECSRNTSSNRNNINVKTNVIPVRNAATTRNDLDNNNEFVNFIKFRERSYSDIHVQDRRLRRGLPISIRQYD